MMQNFDSHKPTLVLAPHLSFPTLNGADIAVDRKWSEFSKFVPYVDIVGLNTITRYKNGKLVSTSSFENKPRSKHHAAILSIINISNYLYEKFITNSYKKVVKKINLNEYSLVVFSYIYTAELRPKSYTDNFFLVETHNYDIEWFDNLSKYSISFITKFICFISKRWVVKFILNNSRLFYTHVSESDMIGYQSLTKHHMSMVVPPGVDVPSNVIKRKFGIDTDVNLTFVGSLGVQMNIDALNFFNVTFFPALKKYFNSHLKITIIGSNPDQSIIDLCSKNNWTLERDVDEARLNQLLSCATFSILPFQYGAGVKLKLLKSLSLGVPVLATSASCAGQNLPGPCLVSDDPGRWALNILEFQKNVDLYDPDQLVHYSENFTWAKMAQLTFDRLNSYSKPK